jgi:Uma2 family endonuclease
MGALRLEDLPHYTYEEYCKWEDNWELIYGVAYAVAPAPIIEHQSISNKIAWQLHDVLKECTECQALLPVDWKIAKDTIVQPDNSVICHTPMHEAYITKAPAIIFEILSPSTAKKDKTLKYNLYEEEGVKYYIIVDPSEEMAKVYRLHEGRYIKLLDASDEVVEFNLEACSQSLTFDFQKIW